MLKNLLCAIAVLFAGTAYGESVVWPVGNSDEVTSHFGECTDWPGQGDGCVWLSRSSKNANSVWRDSNRFLNLPMEEDEDIPSSIWGKYHLGADFNIGAGAADKGQPVRAIADGMLYTRPDATGSWGNIVFIVHDFSFGTFTSMYAHVDWPSSGKPRDGQVSKGDIIGVVGDGNGAWNYHLHFEVREGFNLDRGPGYVADPSAPTPQQQIDPIKFITNIAGTEVSADGCGAGGSSWSGLPMSGAITERFGVPWSVDCEEKTHTGIDIDGTAGDEVRAIASGNIIEYKTHGDYWGEVLVIQSDDGQYIAYLHLEAEVKKGRVLAGQVIGHLYDIPPKGATGSNNGDRLHINFCTSLENCHFGDFPNDRFPGPFVDPVAELTKSAPAFEAQATFSSSFGEIKLPEGSRIVADEKCPRSFRRQLGRFLPLGNRCHRVAPHDGKIFLWHEDIIQSSSRPEQMNIAMVGEEPTVIGKVRAENGVLMIEKSDGEIEFLAFNYEGWNQSAPFPPYDRFKFNQETSTLEIVEGMSRPAVTTVAQNQGNANRTSAQRRTSSGGVPGDTPEEISCNAANWEGVIGNVGDLFECDTFRAMQHLSEYRDVNAYVGDPRFVNGNLSFSWSHRPSYVSEYSRRANQRGSDWNAFLNMTQTYKTYSVRCAFDPSQASALKEGQEMILKAKLVNFQGDSVTLDCKL